MHVSRALSDAALEAHAGMLDACLRGNAGSAPVEGAAEPEGPAADHVVGRVVEAVALRRSAHGKK